MTEEKEHRIGLLTDLHYDGSALAMNRLYDAVTSLNRAAAEVLVVMGDLINATHFTNAMRLLREVSAVCESFRGPIHYMPGNHDLDLISKKQFFTALGCKKEDARCRFDHGGFSIIGLDANFTPEGVAYDTGNFDWRMAAVPDNQLSWLKEQLAYTPKPVLLFSHQRLDKACEHAVQNHEAVRRVIDEAGVVQAVFQGHNHEEDLVRLGKTTYYTLAAHVDEAGPAVVRLKPQGVILLRDSIGLKGVNV